MNRFGANITGAEFQMQQGFTKSSEKNLFPKASDTLVTLTPSYPLVTVLPEALLPRHIV
jgi:hypothetical protein